MDGSLIVMLFVMQGIEIALVAFMVWYVVFKHPMWDVVHRIGDYLYELMVSLSDIAGEVKDPLVYQALNGIHLALVHIARLIGSTRDGEEEKFNASKESTSEESN